MNEKRESALNLQWKEGVLQRLGAIDGAYMRKTKLKIQSR